MQAGLLELDKIIVSTSGMLNRQEVCMTWEHQSCQILCFWSYEIYNKYKTEKKTYEWNKVNQVHWEW